MSNNPYVQPGEPLHEFLRSFWQRQIDAAETEAIDYRHPPLPLARIKKVMKSDPDVKMIAADAPILFCKACEIFISEITARAFIIADSNKRRTLSRSDIAKALGKSDQFDFLIDIVPRDDAPLGVPGSAQHTLNLGVGGSSSEQGRRGQVDGSGRDQPRSGEMENGEDEESPEDDRGGHSSEVLDQLQTLLNHSGPGR